MSQLSTHSSTTATSHAPVTTAADAVIEFLARQGIRALHNFPGGTIAPLLDACPRFGIRVYTSRHEQGAGYAALAQAKLSGLPGIVAVTSGPGVTNVLTPVADAYFDSIPLLVLTGQVGTGDLVNGRPVRQSGFQEINTPALMAPITKAQFQPKTVAELVNILPQAWNLACSGRRGPVSIDLPMDVQRTAYGEVITAPAPTPAVVADTAAVTAFCQQLVAAMTTAKQPLIIAGNGMVDAALTTQLRQLLTLWPIPVSHSLPGVGVIDSEHPLCLGFHGHTGSQVAGAAIHSADLLLVLGSRLDVRQTGTLKQDFAPAAKIFRVDLDPDELAHSRVRHDVVINAELQVVLPELLRQVQNAAAVSDASQPLDWALWHSRIAELRQTWAWPYPDFPGVAPHTALAQLSARMQGPLICTTGVGSHQHWVARHFRFNNPERRFFTSAGHGTMGYDLPTAIGAAIHAPDAQILCVAGDGSLQMNIQELGMIAELGLNIKILVLDNHRLGLVSQFQLLNWSDDIACGHKQSPDFCQIARGYGIDAVHCADQAGFDAALDAFVAAPGAVLMHLEIDPGHDILPMLMGGQAMDKMWPWFDAKGNPVTAKTGE